MRKKGQNSGVTFSVVVRESERCDNILARDKGELTVFDRKLQEKSENEEASRIIETTRHGGGRTEETEG